MDEFVIFGSTEEEHIHLFREVLQKLLDARWTLNEFLFARHGILDVVRSDNGTQFSQKVIDSKYRKFVEQYNFFVVSSSPKHAQRIGFIESMVKNFKLHYLKSEIEDPYLMLLALRSTKLENGYSPAELLMGRKLGTPVPIKENLLNLKLFDQDVLLEKEKRRIGKQKYYFDRHHRVREWSKLDGG